MLTFSASAFAQAGFQVIVNESNPIDLVQSDHLSNVFLKKSEVLTNGKLAVPVDQVVSSAVRTAFSETVHGRTAASVKSYWQRQIFSGSGTPPLELEGDDAVVAFVRENTDGIGYVTENSDLTGVKVVKLMVMPARISTVQPVYPQTARRAGITGQVILNVTIDTFGGVGNIEVVKGLPSGLSNAAIRAVKKWKYRPATIEGVPTEVSINVVVTFTG
jgi:TonB family protein